MTGSFQILCTGDVHLGRRPSRVPIDDDRLSVQTGWERFVDRAVDRRVDAVVLTGDVVDSENQMYEAFGALDRGVHRLVDAELEVVAVAGNHDHEAFPRLMRSVDRDGVHLLGQGGNWDQVCVEGRDDGTSVRFVGWSFSQPHQSSSPLNTLSLSEGEIPTLRVLHCEAGVEDGQYAPVDRVALARAPVTAWLLGHIHAPSPHREAGQLQLYPGSLQPLDPGERGTHGAWLVEVEGETATAENRPLASLRYDEAAVEVSAAETPEEVEEAVLRTVRDRLSAAGDRWPQLSHVVYRIALEGRTNHHREIQARVDDMIDTLRPTVDQVTGSIDGVDLRTRPDYDLETLAQGNDPPSVLAQILLTLEEGSVESDRLDAPAPAGEAPSVVFDRAPGAASRPPGERHSDLGAARDPLPTRGHGRLPVRRADRSSDSGPGPGRGGLEGGVARRPGTAGGPPSPGADRRGTDTFVDGVAELADELDGDAEALKAVIRERDDDRVRGFRTAKADALAAYFREHGYLTDREPLSGEDMWQRILAEVATDRQEDLVTIQVLERLFDRLAGPTPRD